MTDSRQVEKEERFTGKALEAVIRIGVLAALVFWCLQILQPFITPVLWAAVLATALYPAHRHITGLLGGDRRGLAAAIICLLMLLVLVVPAIILTDTLLSGADGVSTALKAGTIAIPPPPAGVQEWPLIGTRVHAFWQLLSENLASAIEPALPHLQALGGWLLDSARGIGLGMLVFLLAIIISGVLLVHAEAGVRTAKAIGKRLAGDRGDDFIAVAGSTVQSVVRGILGVAAIQATLAGIGFLAVGVPGAGLWAMIALFLCIIQIGILPIALPIVFYVFYTAEPLIATVFAVWSVLVALLDNVLKPLLLGRGAPVPTLVIFLGAIGGFLSSGIVGLFVGSVILALGYRLFLVWLYRGDLVRAGVEAPGNASGDNTRAAV